MLNSFFFFQHIHPTETNTFNENSKRKLNNNISVQPYKQLKLSEVGQISKKLTQKEFDRENLKLIINTVSPFSMIEHPAFINYCKLTSNKVPMCRRNLIRDINFLYYGMIQELKTELDYINRYKQIIFALLLIVGAFFTGNTIH